MSAPKRPRPKLAKGDTALQFRVRILHKGEIAFGPGKAELLSAIRKHGSLTKGAKSLGMSYMRAWTLVQVMNASYRGPLIEMERGGAQGGAARLTPLGAQVLDLYSRLVEYSLSATESIWIEFQDLLSK